jgi:hypothetical protein
VRTLGIVALLVVAACGKKDDGAKNNEPAPVPTETKVADNKLTDTRPADPAPADPRPTDAAIDCETLLVAGEIAAACGVDAKDIEVKKAALERGAGATACIRSARLKGRPWLQLGVNAASPSADGAKSLLDLDRKLANAEIKDVDVGDGGLLILHRLEATKSTDHNVEAVKGKLWFKVATTVRDGDQPLCTDDGLVTIAKAVGSRLP